MRGRDAFDPASLHARASGRSWWALRYTDGRLIHEKDRDWSLCPPAGRRLLRLYCPNGEIAELGGDGEQTGRLFQLKVAVVSTGRGGGRRLLAHAIGRVEGTDGRCTLYAWEPGGPPDTGALRAWLAGCAARRGGYTALSAYAGVPLPALAAVVTGDAGLPPAAVARLVASCGAETGATPERARRWAGLPQLAGPIADNAYRMAWHRLGPLCPEHLGIAAA